VRKRFGDSRCERITSSLISSNRLSFLALLFAVASVSPPKMPPKIGQPAPLFALLDQNRKRVSLADAAGTKVVLVFYRGYW
jgi:hypothetical protein